MNFAVVSRLMLKHPKASTNELQAILVKKGQPLLDGRTIAGRRRKMNNVLIRQFG